MIVEVKTKGKTESKAERRPVWAEERRKKEGSYEWLCQGIKLAYAVAYDPENLLLRSLLIGPINLYHSDPRRTRTLVCRVSHKAKINWSWMYGTTNKLILTIVLKKIAVAVKLHSCGGHCRHCHAVMDAVWMPNIHLLWCLHFFWLTFSIGGLKVSFVLKVLSKIHWLLFIREDIL